ncbi:MAG TPA: DUF5818 domain-containing protein [Terriglobales bacterium]|nr:DUF5818 domain-containing protein [Terriglobales bacterium]
MKLWSIPILAILFSSVLAHAQQAPDGAPLFSSDLIAWSFMQQPQQPEKPPGHQQPVPDPNPETKPAQNPTPAQPSSPSSHPGQTSDSQVPSAQTFTGIVSKDADSFVLKVSDTSSYKLDNPQQVQQYQGQRVRVTGTLDPSINLIHVDRIEPIS